jgi:hypothetical protein
MLSVNGWSQTGEEAENILWTILLLMLLLWAIGSLSGFRGSMVNLFLAGAIAIFIVNLCTTGLGRRAMR